MNPWEMRGKYILPHRSKLTVCSSWVPLSRWMELTTTKIPSRLLLSPTLTLIFHIHVQTENSKILYCITKSVALKSNTNIRRRSNLVPRAFPSKHGWGRPHPCFEGKALGTRLDLRLMLVLLFRATDLVIQYSILEFSVWTCIWKMSVSVGLRRSLEGILVVVSSIHRLRGTQLEQTVSLDRWGKIYFPRISHGFIPAMKQNMNR